MPSEEAYQTLLSRRSIREYKPASIPQEIVRKLLEAAMCAPSARHQEPWHFIVIDERRLLDEIVKIHPHAQMLKTAPLAILICGEARQGAASDYIPLDCGNATLNLLQAAHALGLGGVWVGVYPRKERMEQLASLLGLPSGVFPFALAPLGYPAEAKGKENRYKQERVHTNKW